MQLSLIFVLPIICNSCQMSGDMLDMLVMRKNKNYRFALFLILKGKTKHSGCCFRYEWKGSGCLVRIRSLGVLNRLWILVCFDLFDLFDDSCKSLMRSDWLINGPTRSLGHPKWFWYFSAILCQLMSQLHLVMFDGWVIHWKTVIFFMDTLGKLSKLKSGETLD